MVTYYRPSEVLQKALKMDRLAHGILLHGSNIQALEALSVSLAGQLLKNNCEPICSHPDFFVLRPSNKMRQINAADTRKLIGNIQMSPNQGTRKVVLIYEADRMNIVAANAFLKILEEPPLNTTLFLITSRLYAILDTIRSRCMNFRIPAKIDVISDKGWQEWLADYKVWINIAQEKPKSPKDVTNRVMKAYRLMFYFGEHLERIANTIWERVKEGLPENMTDNQEIAQKTGSMKALRSQMFSEIEVATRDAALSGKNGIETTKLSQSIRELERVAGLIEVNLNESAALEVFLLESLRIWAS